MRARLSAAAYEVIAERGHSAFRTAAVAARAGVSEGALLHHFPTKEDVTLAAIEQALSLASTETQKRIARVSDDASAVLKAMLADFRAFFLGDRFWAALGITMDATKNSGIGPKIRKVVSGCRSPIYTAWEQKLVGCGWQQKRAEQAVAMTAALVCGFAIRSLWSQGEAALKSVEGEWLNFIERRSH
jgi:AcrR family transcriptional regulator